MRRPLILAGVILGCSRAHATPQVQDGDLIFHTSRSSQSLAIQHATGSKYSHMAIVLHRNGRPYVFEAISTVQYMPLGRWIQRGSGHHFVVKRLKDSSQLLTPQALDKLREATRQFQGRPYDLTFEWSDARLYCSELV